MTIDFISMTILCLCILIASIIFYLVIAKKISNCWQLLTKIDFYQQEQQKLHDSINQLGQQSELQQEKLQHQLTQGLNKLAQQITEKLAYLQLHLQKQQSEFRQQFDKHQFDHLKSLQDTWRQSAMTLQKQINDTLNQNAKNIDTRMEKLTTNTDQRLKEISNQVEKRLHEGFEKTNATFSDIVKRLALIDAAQKKITELSSNVVSLQEILSDKRSRGAFGEVQLNALLRNVMPEHSFSLQATLSNGKRVDCLLYLPQPTGNIAIDAKFPLEDYRNMTDIDRSSQERRLAEQQFRVMVKKHIQDISSKYILPGETSDGAIMFLPAEAIFAEIHSHYADLIEFAHKNHVWLVSPTTLMAILTTARAVLKDEATRKQIHIIQEHLGYLAKDFSRFEQRMDKLGKHIEQANTDVKDIHTSARKITSRFEKIEKAELSIEQKQVNESIEALLEIEENE